MNLRNVNSDLLSLEEYATLANYIYENIDAPEGWTLIHSVDNHAVGHRSACYGRDLLTENARAVMVHRGTVLDFPDGIGDVIGDIEVAMGKVPIQVDSLEQFIMETASKIAEIYMRKDGSGLPDPMSRYLKTSSTGHSLGGILSDIACAGMAYSITFENPGSKPIIKKIMLDMGVPEFAIDQALVNLKKYFYVYQDGVNLINTCNEQTGTVFRLDNIRYSEGLHPDCCDEKDCSIPIPSDYLLSYFYVVKNTAYQHTMAKMIGSLKMNDWKGFKEVENPIGFKAGYAEYLDAKNNDKYWDEYFDNLWKNDWDLQKEYHGDQGECARWFFKQLKITQDKARGHKSAFDNNVVMFKPNKLKVDDFYLVERNQEEHTEENGTRSACSLM